MEDKVPDDRGGDEAREGQYIWDGVYILVGCELGQDLEERFFGCWRDWSGTGDSQSTSKGGERLGRHVMGLMEEFVGRAGGAIPLRFVWPF